MSAVWWRCPGATKDVRQVLFKADDEEEFRAQVFGDVAEEMFDVTAGTVQKMETEAQERGDTNRQGQMASIKPMSEGN